MLAIDFGDAPDSYRTTLEAGPNGGARHLGSGPMLGFVRDLEGDAQTPLDGSGDDNSGIGDDEDGVLLSNDFRLSAGGLGAARVTIGGGEVIARLYGFIDFNGDGDFEDSGEQVADGTGAFAGLIPGTRIFNFNVPDTGFRGDTFARFRVSTEAGLSFDGPASDGEVEDYALHIGDPEDCSLIVTTAADIVDGSDSVNSLREAIQCANETPGPNTILVPEGVYTLTRVGDDDDALLGDLDITDDLTLIGVDLNTTVIRAGLTSGPMADGIDRVFDVHSSAENVLLTGLTIRNGRVLGDGGGLRNDSDHLVLGELIITENRALDADGDSSNGGGGGGGIANTGNIVLRNSLLAITYNFAQRDGGGIANNGGVLQQDEADTSSGAVTIAFNVADNSGGGVFQDDGSFTVEGGIGVLLNESALDGGGIASINSSFLSLHDVGGFGEIFNNTAASFGGGVFNGAGSTARLEGFSISDNHADGNGGGLGQTDMAHFTVIGGDISGNSADGDGGGICDGGAVERADGSTFVVDQVIVQDNAAAGFGGGIAFHGNDASFSFTGSLLFNTAEGVGAGIFFEGSRSTFNLAGTVAHNDSEGDGGGIYLDSGTQSQFTVLSSSISLNNADGSGAGIYCGFPVSSLLLLAKSTINGNMAGPGQEGGGIWNSTGSVIINNSTISGNRAGAAGGGVFQGFSEGGFMGSITLVNVTVTLNEAPQGAGLYSAGFGTVTLRNTLVAGNFSVIQDSESLLIISSDVEGPFVSGGHNLIGNGDFATGFTDGVNGDQVGTTAAPIDAVLGPLADNGGPTLTHELLEGSPAIDQADTGQAPSTDQRGIARPQGPEADIGAFEVFVEPVIDFGDAPDSYHTLLASNGAWHTATGPLLGSERDGEADANAPLDGTGDDTSGEVDDEDGVIAVGTNFELFAGFLGSATLVINGGGGNARLYGWVDFNRDGDFDDSGEQIISGEALLADGLQIIGFAVPVDASAGDTLARFRVSTQSGLSFDGAACDGEVEDYPIHICSLVVNTTLDVVDPDDTLNSLREAIICANERPGADSILLPNGTYLLTRAGAFEDEASTGDLDITDDLTIQGAATATTIVDGNLLDRVFHTLNREISGSEEDVTTVTIFGITIRNGQIDGDGGGILNQGSLSLTNTLITRNQAARGGGIYHAGSNTLAVSRTTISSNSAGFGAISGGGIFNADGIVDIEDSTIAMNSAAAQGGGILNSMGMGNTVKISRSTISNNLTGDGGGGGILNLASLIVTNSTISGNSTTSFGGGIANVFDSSVVLGFVTIAGNIADEDENGFGTGGGVFDTESGIVAGNSILGDNFGGPYPDVFGTLVSEGYNLIENTNGAFITGDTTGNILGKDPLLEDLGDNGGLSPTHALRPGSPALNAANPQVFESVDERGVARPQGPLPDIGAFESDLTTAIIVTGADAGMAPLVRVFEASTSQFLFEFFAYSPAFRGGVRVAVGDVNHDGQPDIITGAGPGGGPQVRVFDGATGVRFPMPIGSFFAYDRRFTGGVFVAAGDVNGDGSADIATGADAGGGPHVRVINGATGQQLAGAIGSFFPYKSNLTAGVRVAAGDVNGDGRADIITGMGPGVSDFSGEPGRTNQNEVRIFNAVNGGLIRSFLPFEPGYRGGVHLGVVHFDADNRVEIIVSKANGDGRVTTAFAAAHINPFRHSQVSVFKETGAAQPTRLADFNAYGAFGGSVRVAALDRVFSNLAGDSDYDDLALVTGAGPSGGPQVKLRSRALAVLDSFFAYDQTFKGGIYVAAGSAGE